MAPGFVLHAISWFSAEKRFKWQNARYVSRTLTIMVRFFGASNDHCWPTQVVRGNNASVLYSDDRKQPVVILQTRILNGNFVNEPMPNSITQVSFQTYSIGVKQAELSSSTHGGGTQQ